MVAKNRSAYVSCSKLDLVRTVRKTLRSWTLACGELAPCDAVRVIMAVCCHTLRCVVPPEQAEPCGMILASFRRVDETTGVDCGYLSAEAPVNYETLVLPESLVDCCDPSGQEVCFQVFQPHHSWWQATRAPLRSRCHQLPSLVAVPEAVMQSLQVACNRYSETVTRRHCVGSQF